MTSRSTLYTRFRAPRTNQTENVMEKINVVSLDIFMIHFMINNPLCQVKVFTIDEIDEFFDYITSGVKDVYLFMSNISNNTFISMIRDCPQIKTIYILCNNEQCQNCLHEDKKVRGNFKDINVMIQQFQQDITTLSNQYYSEQSTFQSMDEQSVQFLWWKLFDKFIQYIQYTAIDTNEFIEFSRENFSNNEHELRKIEEFETNYTPDRIFY